MAEEALIRSATSADVGVIAEVTAAAFKTLAISNHTEQSIVAALRAAGALTVSLVAEVDGRVVGHVAFSPVTISDGSRNWYGLGPVSVLPEFQRRGIGSALIREGLSRLKDRGAGGVCLVGHPEYYRRFGFRNVRGLVLEGVPEEVFFVLSLDGRVPQGIVEFHAGFKADRPLESPGDAQPVRVRPSSLERMMVSRPALVPLALLLWLSGPRIAGAAEGQPTLQKTVLFEVPEAHRKDFLAFPSWEPKRRRLGYRIEREGKKLFVIDGKEEPAYDDAGGLRFIRDGAGYLYRVLSGGRYYLVHHDGTERGEIPVSPKGWHEVSPDETVVAVPVDVEGRVAFRIGAVTTKAYDSVYRLRFSPNGKHFAFGAQLGDGHFLVVDDRDLGPFRGIEGFWVGDDGAPAYVAHLPDGPSVFRYGQVEESGDRNDGPMLSLDGKSWAFTRGIRAGRGLRVQMVLNGRNVGREYERIPDCFFLSRDGLHVGFLGAREGRAYLVIDGEETADLGAAWQSTQLVGFAPDAAHFLSIPRIEERSFVKHGSWEGPRLGGFVEALQVTRDGRRIAYAQGVTNVHPIAVRVFLGDAALGDYDRVLHLGFSEDESRLGFVAAEGPRVVEVTVPVPPGP